jgi:hypothetical protein
MGDTTIKKHTFEDIVKEEGQAIIKAEMKGSTTLEPTQHFAGEKRKDRKISSSEIIAYKESAGLVRMARHDSMPRPV